NPLPCKMMGFGFVVQNQKLAFLTAVIHNFKIVKRLIIRFKKKGVVAVKSSSSRFYKLGCLLHQPTKQVTKIEKKL
ncbi:MAG: hypothetical protein RBR47_14975, partial [Bacteroidales bacterium]|nr:hypothetical protein [Bacteroidales bacterium]MDY0336253.1 hypothetical protein [Bacteroidales bacterium]